MTRTKKLSTSLLALALAILFLLTMLPSLTGGMNVEAKNPDGRNRLGCWWWDFTDATNATTRENYLTLLEETGVTEVYIEAYTYLWSTSKHAQLHTFIDAAMKHGIRTSVMIDDPALATSSGTSKRYIENLYSGYVAYQNTYPDDWLYGIHFDVEPGGYNATVLQNYLNNLLTNAVNTLIANGIYCEFDVNPAWNGYNGITYDGCTNFYQALAKTLANGKGCVSFMSYRNTAEKVVSRANERQGVDYAKQYNCDYTYGIETDNVETGVDIHNKDKAYLCSMLDYIFGVIDKAGGKMNAGIAIHHASTYYQLAGTLPTTKVWESGGTTASHASYTVKTTASTKPHTGTLQKTALWEGDLNATVIIENYIGVLDNAEVDAAIRADIAKNGTIEDDEYYEIFTTGYMQGQSGYAVAGFLTGDAEFWGDAKAQFCAPIGESKGLTCQKCIGNATTKKGALMAPDMDSVMSQLAYFSDADGYTDKVYITHLEINVYRYSGGDTPTQSSQSQSTSNTRSSQITQPTTTPSYPVGESYAVSYNIAEEAPRYNNVARTGSEKVGPGPATVTFTLPKVWKGDEMPVEDLNEYLLVSANGQPMTFNYTFGDRDENQQCDVIATATLQVSSDIAITGEIKHPNFEAFKISIVGSAIPSVQTTKSTTQSTSQPTSASSIVSTTPSSSRTTSVTLPTQSTQPTQPTQPSQSSATTVPSGPVIEVLYGDANDDGEVNMKDVLALRKYLAGMGEYINPLTSDVENDGSVNMKDVLLLRKYLANLVTQDALGPKK